MLSNWNNLLWIFSSFVTTCLLNMNPNASKVQSVRTLEKYYNQINLPHLHFHFNKQKQWGLLPRNWQSLRQCVPGQPWAHRIHAVEMEEQGELYESDPELEFGHIPLCVHFQILFYTHYKCHRRMNTDQYAGPIHYSIYGICIVFQRNTRTFFSSFEATDHFKGPFKR